MTQYISDMTDKREKIGKWRMTPDEASVYGLALLYQQEFLKLFQGTDQSYKLNTVPKTIDPRKSNLFRHCWRLRRETKGLLQPDQYRQYIHANLMVLKLNKAAVRPDCICGDRAWIRWKVWERWYNQKIDETNVTLDIKAEANLAEPRIIRDIDQTKKFVFEICEGSPTQDKVKELIDSGNFRVLVMMRKISPCYLVLSPFVSKSCDVAKLAADCCIDPALIKDLANEAVRNYFKKEFEHEYRGTATYG